MSYNRRNFLNRVEKVQQIYLQHKEDGITSKYIYNKYVKDEYHISFRTFYYWLSVNVKKDRREMSGAQLALF